jgi:hypothetical protein
MLFKWVKSFLKTPGQQIYRFHAIKHFERGIILVNGCMAPFQKKRGSDVNHHLFYEKLTINIQGFVSTDHFLPESESAVLDTTHFYRQ